jgi:hypothetical protein
MSKRILVVEDQADSQAEADEEMITFSIPDEALEQAASAERQAFTWMYCTKRLLLNCNWPQ